MSPFAAADGRAEADHVRLKLEAIHVQQRSQSPVPLLAPLAGTYRRVVAEYVWLKGGPPISSIKLRASLHGWAIPQVLIVVL